MEMESTSQLEVRTGANRRNTLGTILLFESDDPLRKIISLALNQHGYTVLNASNSNKAKEILTNQPTDLFILELNYPEKSDGDLIDLYRQHNPSGEQAVLVLTTQRPKDDWRNRYRPDVVIYKPFDIRFLMRRILDLTEKRSIN